MFISFLEYLTEAKKQCLDGNTKSRPIAWKDYFKILKKMGYTPISGTYIKLAKIGNDGKPIPGMVQINHHLKGHGVASVVTPDMQREDVEAFILNGDIDPNDIGSNPNFPIQMHKLVPQANARIKANQTLKRTHMKDID